jgi:FkbM family methyltransferase
MGILRKALKLVPIAIRRVIAEDYRGDANFYFSQEGEDILLQRLFGDRNSGLFVDIGAHHPKRFSNTYALYARGWRGINVDATPGSMEAFKKSRPEDRNLECGVGNSEGELPFYEFEEPALNTFSRQRYEYLLANTSYKVKRVVPVRIRKLASILEEHASENRPIDLLTIDVEGLDYEILKSNNWERFSPKVVLVEALEQNIEELQNSELGCFLKEKGYSLFAKTYNTAFFILGEN